MSSTIRNILPHFCDIYCFKSHELLFNSSWCVTICRELSSDYSFYSKVRSEFLSEKSHIFRYYRTDNRFCILSPSSTRIACDLEIMPKVSDHTRTRIKVLDKQGLTPFAILRSLRNEGLSASLTSVTRIVKKL